jgi:hypothetical protein
VAGAGCWGWRKRGRERAGAGRELDRGLNEWAASGADDMFSRRFRGAQRRHIRGARGARRFSIGAALDGPAGLFAASTNRSHVSSSAFSGSLEIFRCI